MLNKEEESSLTQSNLFLGTGGKWVGCLLIWKSEMTHLGKKYYIEEVMESVSKTNNF